MGRGDILSYPTVFRGTNYPKLPLFRGTNYGSVPLFYKKYGIKGYGILKGSFK